LALGLYDDVIVRIADDGLTVDVAGEGMENVPRDEGNLVVTAMRKAFDALGGQPRGLEVVCANRIPHGRGLGSSAAAIVAGMLAAREVTLGGHDRLDDTTLLALATDMEGHIDNAAASLLGGLTLSWQEGTTPAVVRLEPAADVAPVAFIPQTRSSTSESRQLLPEQVSHVDAAASVARAGLLVEALTRRPELLMAATEDRLHQPYRFQAMPESGELVSRLRAAGFPAVLSGAGPSVLALVYPGQQAQVAEVAGKAFTAVPLSVDRAGAQVLPLGA
jgi:homoserine kinase